MTLTCPACAYDNQNDAEFCEACGCELATIAPVSMPDPIPTPIPTPVPVPVPSPEPVSPLEELNGGTFTPPPTFPPFPPSPTSATARLICKQPGATISEFPLDGSNIIIGKFDPDMGPVDIDLDGFPGDETISRNHGEIYREGGTWKIKDLGSSNGIFLKQVGQSRFGARITTPETIASGDEIVIAKIRFLFQSP